METRANFVLIGAFTLAAILGTLGFFIWLASVQLDRQYATYGILFDDVTGLDASGAVTYNGIAVGSVIGLRIFEDDPSKVFTIIEVDAATPVSTATVAQLQSQGVTGVAFISLSVSQTEAAPIETFASGLPVIASRRSTVQALVEDAPDLLAEARLLLQQAQVFAGSENQALVADILRNLARTSGQLDQALSDFSEISGTVRDATSQITLFTERLDTIGEAVETTLRSTDSALVAVQQAFVSADAVLNTTGPALERAESTFALAEDLLRDQIPTILAQVSDTVTQANAAVQDIQTRTGRTLDGFGDTADLLNARLVELETTLADATIAFDAVTTASESLEVLVEGDGAEFIAEARAAIATVETVVNTDLPLIVADVRTAVQTASLAVEDVAADVTGFTSRLTPLADDTQEAVTAATDLIAQAQTSLAALNTTLVVVDGALGSAQTTFDTANDVLQSDLGPVLSDLRTSAERISIAVEDVTGDVPAIAADLRALIARADAVVAQVQTAVAQSAPGISNFSTGGLTELSRLATEARGLIATLNSLTRRIENDPAGFILDNRVPEYRR
ncbi:MULTISPECIES: MlaD family protein [unclassified Yoonia]|uniref:MlaD family protein n=1 Tax=unclassified Yoonia TaxID=2629118 RepID=UPI002B000C88|nr:MULTISPECIES: MlaD family protein [unclassified Yoonia]